MPRQSAESRAAAAFRAGAEPPRPPSGLSAAAKAVWVEIVASKPADFFDAGARPLLIAYCEAAVHVAYLARKLQWHRSRRYSPDAIDCEKRFVAVSGAMTTLSTKLRLSVQALVDRRSRGLLEQGAGSPTAKKPDRLLGGEAVWGDPAKPN